MTALRKITELTIERSKWLRGNPINSTLLRGDGCMCCLGFACAAMGVPPVEMLERDLPVSVGMEIPLLNRPLPDGDFCDTDFTCRAVDINDARGTSDEDRERALTDLFAAAGIALRFVP